MRKILALLIALALLVCAVPAFAEEAPVTVTEIQKYGNLVLSLSGSDFFARGYSWGDVVNVTINGQTLEMPVGSNYSDVDQGSMICRVVIKEDLGEDYIILAINMGDLATATGIATKEKTEADPGYVWHYNEGVEEPVAVTFEMKEQAGYYDQWVMHQLVRSENREDYPDLSDEQFANFRAVKAGTVAEGRLYRSSSPVNPEIARNTYADAAAAAAGVKTFVNLADNEETMKGYEGFDASYYSAQNIIALNLGVDFSADEFRAGLAEGIRFIAANEGPYLVHCTEGKDRAGFVSAILECLMGATDEEVTADYMITYFNYYGVQPGTEQYDIIANSNIRKSLAAAFGLETIEGADLQACAEAYLLGIGLTQEEIDAVKANLGA
ncbi:MAG: tyrosine-protein phosphatase [Clostridia bacterium]|nr:tyrosine-protein phosphatase [Clostridia bacterium]